MSAKNTTSAGRTGAASAPPVLRLDDLPLLLALGRAGTLAGAAAALAVDVSTVFRRLNRLESRLRARFFDRSPHGYQPTEAGAHAIAVAERLETELQSLDRAITGRDQRLSGLVRVSASETLAYRVLPRLLAAFRAAHPGIELELAIDNRIVDLARREADVALRVRRPTDPDLFGRRLATLAWGVYAARGARVRLRRRAGRLEFGTHAVIGWEAGTRQIVAAEWVESNVPRERLVFRSNSLLNHFMAVRAGVGLAALPCYLADPERDVRRVADLPELQSELWIVTHKALRDTARIRAFLEIVGDGIAQQRAALEGRAA